MGAKLNKIEVGVFIVIFFATGFMLGFNVGTPPEEMASGSTEIININPDYGDGIKVEGNIFIEIFPNRQIRGYNTDYEINESQVKKIMEINGIVKAYTSYSIKSYGVSIEKGVAFKWNDLEPKITDILHNPA